MALNSDLTRALYNDIAANSGVSLQPLTDSRGAGSNQPVEISEELRNQLGRSFVFAMQQDMSIPASTRPLNERELHFLRTHSRSEISSSGHSPNLLMQFCVQVIQATFVHLATTAIQGALNNNEPTRANPSERIEEVAEERTPSNLERHAPPPNPTVESLEASEEVQSQEVATQGTDPSLETMKKIASVDIQKKISSSVTQIIKDDLKQLGARVGEDRLLQAIGEGASLKEAASRSAAAVQAQEAYIRHAGKVIGTAVKTGEFFSKMEEIGWKGAAAEMVKSTAIGFVSKYSAKMVTSLAGCTNPIWCAGVVTTIISDAFIPIETAPPEHDMRRPLPPPSLSDVTRSRIPPLNTSSGATIREALPRSLDSHK